MTVPAAGKHWGKNSENTRRWWPRTASHPVAQSAPAQPPKKQSCTATINEQVHSRHRGQARGAVRAKTYYSTDGHENFAVLTQPPPLPSRSNSNDHDGRRATGVHIWRTFERAKWPHHERRDKGAKGKRRVHNKTNPLPHLHPKHAHATAPACTHITNLTGLQPKARNATTKTAHALVKTHSTQ